MSYLIAAIVLTGIVAYSSFNKMNPQDQKEWFKKFGL